MNKLYKPLILENSVVIDDKKRRDLSYFVLKIPFVSILVLSIIILSLYWLGGSLLCSDEKMQLHALFYEACGDIPVPRLWWMIAMAAAAIVADVFIIKKIRKREQAKKEDEKEMRSEVMKSNAGFVLDMFLGALGWIILTGILVVLVFAFIEILK